MGLPKTKDGPNLGPMDHVAHELQLQKALSQPTKKEIMVEKSKMKQDENLLSSLTLELKIDKGGICIPFISLFFFFFLRFKNMFFI